MLYTKHHAIFKKKLQTFTSISNFIRNMASSIATEVVILRSHYKFFFVFRNCNKHVAKIKLDLTWGKISKIAALKIAKIHIKNIDN